MEHDRAGYQEVCSDCEAYGLKKQKNKVCCNICILLRTCTCTRAAYSEITGAMVSVGVGENFTKQL